MVAFGGDCYVSGGSFQLDTSAPEARDHGKLTRGPIRIDRKSRFGMRAMVLDGVHVHEGCIIGAGSIVTDDLPSYSIAAGIPAVVKSRRETTDSADANAP
jgi:acetyltransferase-like isoleucine patch superfamily enzyme